MDSKKTHQDPDKKGNQGGNQKDAPTQEDIKNLQKKLTERDKEFKELEQEKKELERKKEEKKKEEQTEIEKVKDEVKKLTGEISVMNKKERRGELKKSFPDINPDLLIEKTDEQIEKLVTEQRKINKSRFGDSSVFQQPVFESVDDVNKAIKKITEDTLKTGKQKAVELMKLGRVKKSLFKN